MYRQRNLGALAVLVSLSLMVSGGSVLGQGTPARPYHLVQQQAAPDPYRPNDAYQPNDYRGAPRDYDNHGGAVAPRYEGSQRNDAYVPPGQGAGYGSGQGSRDDGRAVRYADPPPRYVQPYRPPEDGNDQRGYQSNDRYGSNDGRENRQYDQGYNDRAAAMPGIDRGTYSENEVIDAGHRFFGSLSNGLAKAVQWAFKKSGRPNGYILGEDAGGAFVAGLRYGEGKLYTKNYGVRRVFWQGPSIGYDFGGDGNRTMTLVYNLRSPGDVFRRFGGVQGAAYLVGGVSVQLLTADDMTLAPIRTGVGLRLGANIGYLKYTRKPTWNPF